MLKVSNSELRALKRCKRKWWLSYYLRLRPVHDGVGPLSVGNMIHHPLEMYYADPNRDPATFNWEGYVAAYFQERLQDVRFPEHLHPAMTEDFELAKIMLRGYFEWLQEDGADSDIDVISAEREVEVYLDTILETPVFLISKLDTEVRLKGTGLRGFMDHKSVANVKDLPKLIELDEQLRFYGLIQRMEALAKAHETGNPPETEWAHGGMLNMLRKVKRTAKANPPFYGRAGVRHNDTVYSTFHTRVWGEVYDLLTLRARLDSGADPQQVAYPTPTRDCDWDCPFKLICPRFDDGSDVLAIIQTQYETHDPLSRYTEIEKG
jgi:hypothetical protein